MKAAIKERSVKEKGTVKCLVCGLGRCCRDGVEADLFEVAEILKARLPIPKPWFRYIRRDGRSKSGYVFSTVVRHGRCVFQNDRMLCAIYDLRPRYCREFPLEDGRRAPYYHVLCHHAPSKKRCKV